MNCGEIKEFTIEQRVHRRECEAHMKIFCRSALCKSIDSTYENWILAVNFEPQRQKSQDPEKLKVGTFYTRRSSTELNKGRISEKITLNSPNKPSNSEKFITIISLLSLIHRRIVRSVAIGKFFLVEFFANLANSAGV